MTVADLRRLLDKFRDDARVMVRCNFDDLFEAKSVSIPTEEWLHADPDKDPMVVIR